MLIVLTVFFRPQSQEPVVGVGVGDGAGGGNTMGDVPACTGGLPGNTTGPPTVPGPVGTDIDGDGGCGTPTPAGNLACI